MARLFACCPAQSHSHSLTYATCHTPTLLLWRASPPEDYCWASCCRFNAFVIALCLGFITWRAQRYAIVFVVLQRTEEAPSVSLSLRLSLVLSLSSYLSVSLFLSLSLSLCFTLLIECNISRHSWWNLLEKADATSWIAICAAKAQSQILQFHNLQCLY